MIDTTTEIKKNRNLTPLYTKYVDGAWRVVSRSDTTDGRDQPVGARCGNRGAARRLLRAMNAGTAV
jgi:non-canonical (house-cleaning) NTP pyrophosphatase